MTTDTTVKYFHSSMTGAPTISGQAGTLIATLDACLVNGFGSGTLDSLVIAGGIATATRAAGHSGEVGAVMLLAGGTVSGGGSVNGEKKVITATATTFTFDATGISNQTATGTITAKIAPATWAKTYSGTNLAAYKPSDVTATGCLLRVDDTGTTNSRVVGYETMSDVNTGTGAFPTSTQVSGGAFWAKSSAANSTTRPWILVSDGRMFYLSIAYTNGSTTSYQTFAFGDPINTKSSDPYCCLLNAAASDETGSTAGQNPSGFDRGDGTGVTGACYMPRAYTGLGTAITFRKMFPPLATATTVYSGASGVPYPNPADGGLYVVPHYLLEQATVVLRATSPGFYCTPQFVGITTFANRDSVTGVTGLTGKTLKAVLSGTGTAFIDITGPWR